MRIKGQILKVAVLGALLGMAGLANAAVPAGSLPGSFQSNVSTTYSGSGSTGTITYNSNAQIVMQWGGTPDISTQNVSAPAGITTNAGFDVGQGATLNIVNQGNTGTRVLVVDATGNPSEIAGTIGVSGPNGGTPSLMIANANGVTVDGTATIIQPSKNMVAILGYGVDPASYVAANGLITINGTTPTNNGTVTIAPGSNLTGVSTLLVAGNGNVNIGTSNLTGNNSAGNVFVASAGEGVKITTAITTGQGVINPNAVLNLSGGSASNPMELDVAQGGIVNVTGAIAGDPGSANTIPGLLELEQTSGLNIEQGATASGSDVGFLGLPAQGDVAGNVNIYGTVNVTGYGVFPGGNLTITQANSILEWGNGVINFPNATASNIGFFFAQYASDLFNPTNYHANNGNLLYGALNINAGTNGAGTITAILEPMGNIPGASGQLRKYADLAVNGSLGLANPAQGDFGTNLGLASDFVTPAGTQPDSQSGLGQFLVASATGDIFVGGGNQNPLIGNGGNFYWPGFLGLVNVTPGNPAALNPNGSIVLLGSLSNAVNQIFAPTGLFTSGGMYLLSLNPIGGISSTNTITTNENSNISVSGAGTGNAAYYTSNGYAKDFYQYSLNGTNLVRVNVMPMNTSAQ